jgi:tetratricopeptide (TPR) repeat protein
MGRTARLKAARSRGAAPGPSAQPGLFRVTLVVVPVGLAVLLPLLHGIGMARSPAFVVPIIDAQEYVRTALRMLEPTYVQTEPFYHSPLYPWFLRAVFGMFGLSLAPVRLVQALLNGLIGLLVYHLGRRAFGRPSALVAAFLWACWGPAVFYAGEILNVTLLLFLQALTVYLVMAAWRSPSVWRWGLAGLAAGAAAITRPDILPFAVLAAGACLLRAAVPWWSEHLRSGRAGAAAAALCAGVAAPLIIVGAVNHRATGRFLMLPVNSGLNFYIGNNPDARTTIGIRPGAPWDELNARPVRDGVPQDPHDPANNAYFYRRAFEFIRRNPVAWLDILWYKVRTLIGGYELPETFDLYVNRRFSPVLAVLVWRTGMFAFPWGVFLPLAAVTVWRARRSLTPPAGLLLLFAGSVLVPLLGFWNSSRYRMPLVIPIVVFAGAGLVELSRQWREDRRRFARTAAAVLVGVVICALPYRHFSTAHNFLAEIHAFAGMAALDEGRIKQGIALLDRALALEPGSMDVRANRAWAAERAGDLADAISRYEALLREHPGAAKVRNNLAFAYSKAGRDDLALEQYREAVRLDPAYPDARYNLGNALMRNRRFSEAVEQYRAALRLRPAHAESWFNLGSSLEQLGDTDGALAAYGEYLRIKRDSPDGYNRVAILSIKRGDLDRGIEYFRRALAVKPDYAEIRENLRIAEQLRRSRPAAPPGDFEGVSGHASHHP